ncbi:MAG: ribosomal RNA large subunit methyltransferase E [Phycisphaeraceae bacterium]|nr:MAG: ribosomal RNA large subunit methyltransferase E [Phycisphaeraceae bacterium]
MPRVRKLHDGYFHQAKREGYVARSAYKLLEINEKKKLVRKGDWVLDLGCAPGSWLQAAAELVGPKGRVVGIDLKPVDHPMPENVRTLVGDLTTTDPSLLTDTVCGRFKVVISDMAPNTTGAGDDFRSVRLCRAILERLPGLIAPKGNLTMKVFEGAEMPELVAETRALFTEAGQFKPRASREVSRETYVFAKGYRGPVTMPESADPAEPGA